MSSVRVNAWRDEQRHGPCVRLPRGVDSLPNHGRLAGNAKSLRDNRTRHHSKKCPIGSNCVCRINVWYPMQRMPSDNSTGISLFVVVHLTTMNTFQWTTCFPSLFLFPVYLQVENRRWNKATCRPVRNEDNSAISFYFGLTVWFPLSLSLSPSGYCTRYPGISWPLCLKSSPFSEDRRTVALNQLHISGCVKTTSKPFWAREGQSTLSSSYFSTIHCNIILPDTRWLQRQRLWLVFGRCWDQIWALNAEELTDLFHGLISPSKQNG